MADESNATDTAAEKAFADAAEKKTAEAVSAKSAAKPAETAKPATAPAEKAPAEKAPVEKTVATKKPAAAKKAPAKAKRVAPKKPAAKKIKVAARKPAAKTAPTTKSKDTIMANAKTNNTDFTNTAKNAAAELQTRAKATYAKSTEATAEATEFQKGNLEALVESGKIFAAGMQDMGRSYVEDTKAAVETVQDDVRKIAAIKSPTELFQLQSEIARRNFDAAVAAASKNSEAFLKLATEAFGPVSSRMSLATEKFSKAA